MQTGPASAANRAPDRRRGRNQQVRIDGPQKERSRWSEAIGNPSPTQASRERGDEQSAGHSREG